MPGALPRGLIPAVVSRMRHVLPCLAAWGLGILAVGCDEAGWWARERQRLAAKAEAERYGENVQRSIQMLEAGDRLYGEGRLEEALAEFERAAALDPVGPDALLRIARIHRDRRRFDPALAAHQEAIRRSPARWDLHDEMGVTRLLKGDAAYALEAFREAARLDPKRAAPLNHAAWAHYHLKEADKAVGQGRAAVDREPLDASYLADLGFLLYSLGRTDDAVETLRRAVEQDPKNAAAHHHLGLAFERKGSKDLARQAFKKAADLEPKNPQYLRSHGLALAESGAKEEAARVLKRILEIDPYDEALAKEVAALHPKEAPATGGGDGGKPPVTPPGEGGTTAMVPDTGGDDFDDLTAPGEGPASPPPGSEGPATPPSGGDDFSVPDPPATPAGGDGAAPASGGGGSGGDLGSLVEMLGDADWRVREQAKARLFDAGKAAVPALKEAMKRKTALIREGAEQVLKKIEASETLPPSSREGDLLE